MTPDDAKPSNPFQNLKRAAEDRAALPTCGHCMKPVDIVTGVYDDGEWICAECIAAKGK